MIVGAAKPFRGLCRPFPRGPFKERVASRTVSTLYRQADSRVSSALLEAGPYRAAINTLNAGIALVFPHTDDRAAALRLHCAVQGGHVKSTGRAADMIRHIINRISDDSLK